MALAFKEWSYIVDALGKGKQNLIIRKGGLREPDSSFQLAGQEFLLFPTLYHQATESIKPEWLPFLKGDTYHQKEGKVLIKYFARIADAKIISDKAVLQKLNAYHAWKPEVISERFDRWESQVHLLIVQVFELGAALELDLLPEYEGCLSWLNIDRNIEFIGRPINNPMII
jgi:hypothetical protein